MILPLFIQWLVILTWLSISWINFFRYPPGYALRRWAKIVERHSDMLARLYTPEGKNMVNQRNVKAIKKSGGAGKIRYHLTFAAG